MATKKRKRNRENKDFKIAMICLGVVILIIAVFIARYKVDEYGDKLAMEQTVHDVSKLYDKFVAATPEQEELVYRPENTCGYKSSLFAGYECQTEASIRYGDQDGDLSRYSQYIDQSIDLSIFTVEAKESSQKPDNYIYYRIQNKISRVPCTIYGSYSNSKARFTIKCTKDSKFRLYAVKDDRKDERIYSE